jgi:hypothetical protein
MSIIALYVHSTTTFKTDTRIESTLGDFTGTGLVTLQPGLYRVGGGATVEVAQPTTSPGFIEPELVEYTTVIADGTKTIYPDPPQQQLGLNALQIKAFLDAAGEENELNADQENELE